MVGLDTFMSHHGIKGMRWGVRRSHPGLSASDRKRVAIRKPRTKKELKARSKRQRLSDRRRQLSDKDLKDAVERLQTEKKLKDLVEQDLKPGRSAVKKILGSTGTKVAGTVAAGAATVAVKNTLVKSGKVKQETIDMILRGGKLKKG